MLTINLLDYIYTIWSRFIYLACARRAHNQNSVFTHDDVWGIDSASRFFRIFLQKAESSAAAPRVMSIGVQAQKTYSGEDSGIQHFVLFFPLELTLYESKNK